MSRIVCPSERQTSELEKMKNKIQFMNLLYYRAFVCCGFALVVWRIVALTRQVSFEDIRAYKSKSVEIEIDICYPLELLNETYEIEENQEYKNVDKVEFDETCNFEFPLAHYTKGFKEKTAKEIISKFEQCAIENLALVEISNETIGKQVSSEIGYILYFGKICVQHKHEFLINKSNELIEMKIIAQENIQTFDVYASFARNYENEKYRSVKKHLVKRNCWLESDGEQICLESNKGLILDLIYFSVKSLKSPFITDCTERLNSSNKNDCYEKCFKKVKNHYLLSYNKNDNSKLDYSGYESMVNLSRKCSIECYQEDCKITAFFIDALYSVNETGSDLASADKFGDLKKESNDTSKESNDTSKTNQFQISRNSIMIKGRSTEYRTEALPLVKNSKTIWMIVVYFSVFFGFDIFGILIKTTKIYENAVGAKKRDRKASIKQMIFGSCIFLASFTLALNLEKLVFNFGNLNDTNIHKTYRSEIESTKERNVSLSVCYDLCMILKSSKKLNSKNCSNETLIEYTLEQLDKMTWSIDDFKKQASLRNSVKIVPIRHDEFELTVFFRLFRKCFLIPYKGLNVYPHLSLMRKSQLYLKLNEMEDKSRYERKFYHNDYFYIEDGFSYPRLESNYINKSVLHKIIIKYREDDHCIRYSESGIESLKKDDLIQNCLIEKYLKSSDKLPLFVNLKLNNNKTLDSYLKKKFKNESELDQKIFKECKTKFEDLVECEESRTILTNQDIFTDNIGSISVNLTPFLFEIRFFEREHVLIVINRIISFFILFNYFSVCDVIKGFVCTYLHSLASLYNFQFIKKLSYLLCFALFCLNSVFLFNSLANSLTKTYSSELMKKIELPRFQVCFEHNYSSIKTYKNEEEDDIFNEVILYEKLDPDTLNFTDIIDQIIIHQENDEEIEIRDKIKAVKVFYIDNLKCFTFDVNKVYDDPNVPKLETLIEIHVNLEKIEQKRIFFFLNTKQALKMDRNNPFESGMTDIHYLTKEYRIENTYWCAKNLLICLKDYFGIEKFANYPNDYLNKLSKAYEKNQYSATTSVRLYSQETRNDSRFNLPIKNRQFNSFMHFRSIDGKKNDYLFTDNRVFNDYSIVSYKKEKNSKDRNSVKLFLRSNLIKIVSSYNSSYEILEFSLHFLVLLKLYFSFNFLFLPELYKSVLPVIKFFVFIFLYCIVVFILFLFECYFKFIRFLDFKYAY